MDEGGVLIVRQLLLLLLDPNDWMVFGEAATQGPMKGW
jgi:hypothetical protein